MAENNFATCLSHTLEFEGGYSNHPSDPGGETMKGIIQTVYDAFRDSRGAPRQRVRYISDAEVREIYKLQYWDRVFGDSLPAGVDLATFDFGVNSGPNRANRVRNALGGGTPVEIVQRLCAARLSFVQGLGTFAVFGRGWTRRIASIEARGVKMAMDAAKVPPERSRPELERAGRDAGSLAKQQGGGAAGSAGGYWLAVSDPAFLVVAGFALTCAILFAYRAYINWHRARAYAEVANEG